MSGYLANDADGAPSADPSQQFVSLSQEQIGLLLADAEHVAEQTVAEARRIAQEIVTSATLEANRVRSGIGLPMIDIPTGFGPIAEAGAAAEGPAGGLEEVQLLRQALIEFTRTNAALVRGVSALVNELANRVGTEARAVSDGRG